MKIYGYPGIPTSAAWYETYDYHNAVPFSQAGLERYFQQTFDANEADLIYGGMWHDNYRHLLKPERFPYLKDMPQKHIYDWEGDGVSGIELPGWLKRANIIGVNLFPEHRSWPSILVRPGCSRFLMHLVQTEVEYTSPKKHGFYFRGQPDPFGVRARVGEALKIADIDHEFGLNNQWHAVTDAQDPRVKEFERGVRDWSFALCPSGFGHFTVRFYEVCALGRVPVVISDNLWMSEEKENLDFVVRIKRDSTEYEIADILADLSTWPRDAVEEMGRAAKGWFGSKVRRYFQDPTAYYLRHLGVD